MYGSIILDHINCLLWLSMCSQAELQMLKLPNQESPLGNPGSTQSRQFEIMKRESDSSAESWFFQHFIQYNIRQES